MKRWYIEYGGGWSVCSLLGLNGTSKLAHFKSDNGDIFTFRFMKFFDFSRAKNGNQQNGWCHIHGSAKSRSNIIFK